MKRRMVAMSLLLMMTMGIHVAADVGDPIYQAFHEPELERLEEVLPEKLELHLDSEGWGRTAVITDEDVIKEAVELFCDITVSGESEIFSTDSYNWIRMTFEDGVVSFLSLNGEQLERKQDGVWRYYELEGVKPFLRMLEEYLVEDEEPVTAKTE